ncbi:hypothetical protein H6P81_019877 [Aristolochia fimbriata]|uniref:GDSL esterase/lipase n=1 Tax=Aristolochia fimbriata TaxID=158543 RepID=A0AAV7DW69_ARIFI|nr:hypothetical protein H6P81_019877 [Aristolochia fimbriata]
MAAFPTETKFFFSLYLLIFQNFAFGVLEVSAQNHKHGFQKLFVFGDSYADTGNGEKDSVPSWKEPYGVTFPGKPAGRWSDGRVMTDLFASFLGLQSPVPYDQWRDVDPEQLAKGMNFAYGGTGVFDNSFTKSPNMTQQIRLFQDSIKLVRFSEHDLQSSVGLVSLAGNDYAFYETLNGSLQSIEPFIVSVIDQLKLNLNHLRDIGIRRMAVTNVPPLGCLPGVAVNHPSPQCNEDQYKVAKKHRDMLEKAVEHINEQDSQSNDFSVVIIDIYDAFTSVIRSRQDKEGRVAFEKLLQPCCVGVGRGFGCGSTDASGAKKYAVCDDPQSSLFWDSIHPSDGGWAAISSYIRATTEQL